MKWRELKLIKKIVELGPVVNVEQQASLVRPFCAAEVKKAFFDIDDQKAPGPDGYSSKFFNATWGIVGEDITCAVLDFF